MSQTSSRLLRLALLIALLVGISWRQRQPAEPVVETASENAAPFTLEQVREVFPAATALGSYHDEERSYDVLSDDGKVLGRALSTSPDSDEIIGYAGPVPLLIGVDPTAKIVGIALLPNRESVNFMDHVKKSGLFKSWDGLGFAEAATKQVDAVSGATYSSTAVIKSLRKRLAVTSPIPVVTTTPTPRITSKLLWSLPGLFVVVLGLVAYFYPKALMRWRVSQLSASVLVLGFGSGTFLSLAQLHGWLGGGFSLSGDLLILVIAAVAFLLPILTGRNFYCSQLCPYGCAQELAGKLMRKKPASPARLIRYIRYLRSLVLIGIALWLLAGKSADLTNLEPFSAFLFHSAALGVLVLAVCFLVLSLFYPRLWCRALCPTGFLLNQFRVGLSRHK
jgi:hypothetical protein